MYAALFAALTVILLIGIVLTRVLLMKRQGLKAMKFGYIDKKDFATPPFAFFYFYIIFAEASPVPAVSRQEFFRSDFSSWIGVAFCTGGLGLLLGSLISFGRSFRVGIDTDRPDRLVTSGIFAVKPQSDLCRFLLRAPSPSSSYFRTGYYCFTWVQPHGCSTAKYYGKKVLGEDLGK